MSRNQMKKKTDSLNIPTHHVSQADVQEHSSCDGKDHVWCKGASEQNAEDEAHVAGQGWQQVEEDGLRDAHPGVQQDDKVACRELGATTQGSNPKQGHSYNKVFVFSLTTLLVALKTQFYQSETFCWTCLHSNISLMCESDFIAPLPVPCLYENKRAEWSSGCNSAAYH